MKTLDELKQAMLDAKEICRLAYIKSSNANLDAFVKGDVDKFGNKKPRFGTEADSIAADSLADVLYEAYKLAKLNVTVAEENYLRAKMPTYMKSTSILEDVK